MYLDHFLTAPWRSYWIDCTYLLAMHYVSKVIIASLFIFTEELNDWKDSVLLDERLQYELLFYSQGPMDGYMSGNISKISNSQVMPLKDDHVIFLWCSRHLLQHFVFTTLAHRLKTFSSIVKSIQWSFYRDLFR